MIGDVEDLSEQLQVVMVTEAKILLQTGIVHHDARLEVVVESDLRDERSSAGAVQRTSDARGTADGGCVRQAGLDRVGRVQLPSIRSGLEEAVDVEARQPV